MVLLLHGAIAVLVLLILLLRSAQAAETELLLGFAATPSRSRPPFQPILTDPTGNFSLGFLRMDQTELALAVIHVGSAEPLWSAEIAPPVKWSDRIELSFNGSLVISDRWAGVLWSTHSDDGARAVLLNTSDLQVQSNGAPPAVLWRSFNFPKNTLVQNQNFTSTMSLVSTNQLYTMRLGYNFIGLYANFGRGKQQMYWKHKALEAKASIVEGGGPIYARVNPDGFLSMHQNSTKPVDIETFSIFQRLVNSFIILRLESDGNLKGYYWNGSAWITDYRAITDFCELPSPCGLYGLCSRDNGGGGSCTCLDTKRTEPEGLGKCGHGSGDFCRPSRFDGSLQVLRMTGVELPFKELMWDRTGLSLEQCVGSCEGNCSCWGVVFNNATGFCYVFDYPIETLVRVADESKVGYFKVREKGWTKAYEIGHGVGVVVWVVIGLAALGSVVAATVYVDRWREGRRRGVTGQSEEESKIVPGQYKDLRSASFKSIEMGSGS
ncbi:hypothetical protein SAY87_007577 [Trapa incisa]|uniref:Apple domain-containing protein n=2 Tax=Trapa TaxID=22665 RepID=A0AAN7QUL0_TRANT|nr:hypothetical protein SAY87_007577 [Trapa incisa]KAK4776465.1 hypothetical protein SAY86_005153 [Trapa natans]